MNMVRAGEASGSLALVFERLSEFERTRDDLRSYIMSSMAYPGSAVAGGLGVDPGADEFRGAAVRVRVSKSRGSTCRFPPRYLLEGSKFLQTLWLDRLHRVASSASPSAIFLRAYACRQAVVGHAASENSGARRRAAKGGDGALCARHGDAGVQ